MKIMNEIILKEKFDAEMMKKLIYFNKIDKKKIKFI